MQNKTVSLVLIILLVITIAGAIFVNQRSEVVATVNGEKITKDQLYEAFVANGGSTVLEQLVSDRIITQEAKNLGVEVTEEELDAQIEKLIAENYYGMEEYFQQALDQYGITKETLKESMRPELLLLGIVRSKTEVTDEEVEAYFVEHQEDFNIPEKIEVRHILVESEEEANDVFALLQGGGDFAELAKEYSKDPGSASEGGALGLVGHGAFVKEFEEVAFTLPVGEFSEPVESEHGFHIIEVTKKQEAEEVEFADVTEQVKEAVLTAKVNAQVEQEYTTLREDADVETKL
ncbi:MAG: peptidylprolyl isomerase [Firmicutes bacterium]|nr:peptidylprolyl isomerase [Bacillota bacterium]